MLDAKLVDMPVDEGRKAAALAHARETMEILKVSRSANEIGRYAPKQDTKPAETPEQALDRLKGQPLPKLSPEALATLGIKPPPAKVEAA